MDVRPALAVSTSSLAGSIMSLDTVNALIAGVPSQAGSSNYTLQVNDSTNKSATRACTIQINGTPLAIASASLPDGVVGVQYSQTTAASGGHAPYTWSIVSAGAPDGFSLDASGAWTASTVGAFTFTVQVTDQDNNVARQTLKLFFRLMQQVTTSPKTYESMVRCASQKALHVGAS